MTKAILFDIDSTLVKDVGGKHKNAFSEAFRKIYGIDATIDEIQYSGKTDRQILVEILKKGVCLKQRFMQSRTVHLNPLRNILNPTAEKRT